MRKQPGSEGNVAFYLDSGNLRWCPSRPGHKRLRDPNSRPVFGAQDLNLRILTQRSREQS